MSRQFFYLVLEAVLMQRTQIFFRVPSIFFDCRLMPKVLRVAMLEWLRLLPLPGFLPQTAQTLLIDSEFDLLQSLTYHRKVN
jgi:hypothetical protein